MAITSAPRRPVRRARARSAPPRRTRPSLRWGPGPCRARVGEDRRPAYAVGAAASGWRTVAVPLRAVHRCRQGMVVSLRPSGIERREVFTEDGHVFILIDELLHGFWEKPRMVTKIQRNDVLVLRRAGDRFTDIRKPTATGLAGTSHTPLADFHETSVSASTRQFFLEYQIFVPIEADEDIQPVRRSCSNSASRPSFTADPRPYLGLIIARHLAEIAQPRRQAL